MQQQDTWSRDTVDPPHGTIQVGRDTSPPGHRQRVTGIHFLLGVVVTPVNVPAVIRSIDQIPSFVSLLTRLDIIQLKLLAFKTI